MQLPTTLIAPIIGLESLQEFRIKHLHRPSVSLPPHISICPEFLSTLALGRVGLDGISRAANKREPFRVTFHHTERNQVGSNILYLVPDPSEDLVGLYQDVHRAYSSELGEHFHRSFHVTLGVFETSDEMEQAEREFWSRWDGQMPLTGRVDRLELHEKQGHLWQWQGAFYLIDKVTESGAPDLAG